MTGPGRLYHTVRHLRSRQITARLSRPWRAQAGRIGLLFGRRSEYPGLQWTSGPDFVPPPVADLPLDDILGGTLRFVNLSRETGWPPDWQQRGAPPLWRYHLHYHDFLWALPAHEAKRVVWNWIQTHPNRPLSRGWDPYPTSVRLMNWVMVLFGRDRAVTVTDSDFCRAVWHSIQEQARWLGRMLEWHLMANHLFENAAALTMLGAAFKGPAAARWKLAGLRLLKDQIEEQVLPDGTHFERSPMYHCRVVQTLLNLQATQDATVRAMVEPVLPLMLRALAHLYHADGEIALFNDSALGQYPDPPTLLTHAGFSRPSYGPFALREAGYFGYRTMKGGAFIFDAGEIGPDYFPAHAHADTFSFEWSLRGRRIVTDSGMHDYQPSALRQELRGTAAHNTVEVAGANQSDVWSAFRVGRRARPHEVSWDQVESGFRIAGWHDGYESLPSRSRHSRIVTFVPDERVQISDRVDSGSSVEAVSRFHLAPELEVEPTSAKRVRVAHGDARAEFHFRGEGSLRLEATSYAPRFHTLLERTTLCWHMEGERCGVDVDIVAVD